MGKSKCNPWGSLSRRWPGKVCHYEHFSGRARQKRRKRKRRKRKRRKKKRRKRKNKRRRNYAKRRRRR
uniref:Uncharacterized protein n=1 Tax=Octopus bimaculoides TaxID=37653 RepID=A0A0L8HUR4_OCTBM